MKKIEPIRLLSRWQLSFSQPENDCEIEVWETLVDGSFQQAWKECGHDALYLFEGDVAPRDVRAIAKEVGAEGYGRIGLDFDDECRLAACEVEVKIPSPMVEELGLKFGPFPKRKGDSVKATVGDIPIQRLRWIGPGRLLLSPGDSVAPSRLYFSLAPIWLRQSSSASSPRVA